MALWKRLAAGLVTGAMLLTSAGAVSATVNSTTACTEVSAGVYQVEFTNSILKDGNQYVLLVASFSGQIPPSGSVTVDITEGSLTFIDQVAASGGKVIFNNVRPKSTPNSLVLLGGEFTTGSSPIVIGYINGKGELINFQLNDEITGGSNLEGITFSVYVGDIAADDINNSTEVFNSDTSGGDGNVNLQIPPGQVTVQLTREGYVPMTIKNATADQILQYIEKFADCAGDLTGDEEGTPDGMITIRDLNYMLQYLDTRDMRADVNKDGSITMKDLSLMLNNQGATKAKRTYPQ